MAVRAACAQQMEPCLVMSVTDRLNVSFVHSPNVQETVALVASPVRLHSNALNTF